MSKEFTEDGDPTNRYNLRGVSIGPEHTEQYVLVDPSAASTAQQHDDEAIDVEAVSQWWRVQFNSEKPVKEKIDVESVLKAASETSGDVLLVYATDAACERRELNLFDGLRTFVDMDNEHFNQELAAHWERMDTSESQLDLPQELPPAYEEYSENDGRWAHLTSGGGFTPDLGPSLVSDADYQMNTDPNHGYSTAYESYRNAPRDGEDVRMGGTSYERIEDVTEVENSEKRKGG